MIFPEFIKKGQKIGICAPSAGMGNNIEDFKQGLNILKDEGYKIKVTKSCYNKGIVSTGKIKRAKELDELVVDKNIKMIICATGGDFMHEILPHVNFENIINNPKWIMGYSDPTNLLYPLTTKYDIATIYGFNSGYRYNQGRFQKENLKMISGKTIKQKSYNKYQEFLESINGEEKYLHEVKWLSKENINIEGRVIGGCLDVIQFLIGTKFDGTKDFINRYKEDGIVYYFDIFSMAPENVYYTLSQMKNAGYFDYCKGILIGRIAFPSKGYCNI